MSAEKNKANASTEKVSLNIDLGNIFKKLPIDEDDVENLLPLLEPGEKVESKNIDYRDFCKAYTIELIKKYGSTADEKELLLVAFGLLKGFEFDSQEYGHRIIEYRKASRDYNMCLKRIKTENEDSVLRTIRSRVDKIITKLIKRLVEAMENGKLELISTVPDRLRLPELREVYSDNQDDNNESTNGRDEPSDIDRLTDDRNEKGNTAPRIKFIVKHIKEELTFKECFKKYWKSYAIIALLLFSAGGCSGWIAKDNFSSLNIGGPTPAPTKESIENPVNISNDGSNITINNYGTINYSDSFDDE